MHTSTVEFERRLSQWKGELLTFRQLHGHTSTPRIWDVWVEGDTYHTRYGQLDGKIRTSYKKGKAKNVGKVNELTPEQDALAEARRATRKKWDFEGYNQFDKERNMDFEGSELTIPNLLSRLPGSFSVYKPHNNIETTKKLLAKAHKGEVTYSLKRNGLAMWIVILPDNQVVMYSRRCRTTHKNEGLVENLNGTMDAQQEAPIPWAHRFPHIVDGVKNFKLPPYTLMAIELVNVKGDRKEDFSHVQAVEKSKTPRALALQKEHGWLAAYWWDVIFLDGKNVASEWPIEKRYQLIRNYACPVGSWIVPVHTVAFPTPEEAKHVAKEHQLEGWVAVDPNGVYGEKSWNLKGKPDRPREFCAKCKPEWEDDFVAMFNPNEGWGQWGTGKRDRDRHITLPNGEEVVSKGVGSVGLGQYHNGTLRYICDMGAGMTDELCAKLNPDTSFPFVCEVKYNDRSWKVLGDKTDALSFPRLVRVRTDKRPEECIYDPPEERSE